MATLTIRNLDDETKKRLRLRAARHGVSMEQEARSILRRSVTDDAAGARESGASFVNAVRALVERHGAYDGELPERIGKADTPPAYR